MFLTKLRLNDNTVQKNSYIETTLILNEDETAITDLEGEEIYVATTDRDGNEVFVKPTMLDKGKNFLDWVEIKVCQQFDMTGSCLCYAKKKICI
jgi:hypothetical protein